MKYHPEKIVDVNLLEKRLDDLLENYRQALRAAEFLPAFGHVQMGDLFCEYGQEIVSSEGSKPRKKSNKLPKKHFSWNPSKFAVRSLVKMFLRAHVRSKLRNIADKLDIELLVNERMEINSSKQLNNIIERLRNYDKKLANKSTLLNKIGTWIWPVIVSIITAYFSRHVIPANGTTVTNVLTNIATGLFEFGVITYLWVFGVGALAGFRWKRLILLGQAGEVEADGAVIVHWISAPLSNTYQSENQLFEILGLPKPIEFPLDVALAPDKFLSAVLACGMFLYGWAVIIPAKQYNWPVWIASIFVVLSMVLFFFLIIQPLARISRQRMRNTAA